MATITTREIIDEIISRNGDNEESVKSLDVMKIVEYENAGQIMWGMVFRCEMTMPGMANRYEVEGPHVHNGAVIWTRQEDK
jgi:hypothetical protein